MIKNSFQVSNIISDDHDRLTELSFYVPSDTKQPETETSGQRILDMVDRADAVFVQTC